LEAPKDDIISADSFDEGTEGRSVEMRKPDIGGLEAASVCEVEGSRLLKGDVLDEEIEEGREKERGRVEEEGELALWILCFFIIFSSNVSPVSSSASAYDEVDKDRISFSNASWSFLSASAFASFSFVIASSLGEGTEAARAAFCSAVSSGALGGFSLFPRDSIGEFSLSS
jgi:hypothetical protein